MSGINLAGCALAVVAGNMFALVLVDRLPVLLAVSCVAIMVAGICLAGHGQDAKEAA